VSPELLQAVAAVATLLLSGLGIYLRVVLRRVASVRNTLEVATSLIRAIEDALRPDEDGVVRLTKGEVARILELLLELRGETRAARTRLGGQ
jgi:hypothetical protein